MMDLEKLSEISEVFNARMEEIKSEQEQFWNSLTKEQQLAAFCCCVRRIHKGEIEDKGSYRHVLYSVFEFGPEAYAPAQMAGYLDIHNLIYSPDYERKLLQAFAAKNGIPEQAVTEWFM